jgi:D-hydroxyproline dehydrogenase
LEQLLLEMILNIFQSKLKSDNKEYNFDQLLITAGAFSKQFTDQLGEYIPLETERGYHVHFKDSDN